MMRAALTALAIGGLMSSAALAQAPTAASAPPAPAAAPVKPADQIVCKRVDVSGTRIQLPKKCMTRRDWQRMDGPGKDDIQSIVRSNLTRNSTGG